MSKIASLLKDRIVADIEVDGFPGFVVTLAYLSRGEIEKIRKSVTRTEWDKRSHEKKEVVDTDEFTKIMVKASLTNWKGLTLEHVARLAPIEIPAGVDPSTTVDYTPEDAYELTKSSPEFDRWLNDTIFELDNFRKK